MPGDYERGLWGRAACNAPVIWGVPAGVSRPPVSRVAQAGAGQPPVNGEASGDLKSSDAAVLVAMQAQMRGMLRLVNRLVHEKTSATAATAHPSATGEAFWEHRPA
jgi:hypothetical protein